jgi:hypothetical protein
LAVDIRYIPSRRRVVVAEAAGERIEEGALAIRPGAVGEEKRVFVRDARQNVSGHAPEKGN